MFGIRAPVDGGVGRRKPLAIDGDPIPGAFPREANSEGTVGSGRSGEPEMTDEDSIAFIEGEKN